MCRQAKSTMPALGALGAVSDRRDRLRAGGLAARTVVEPEPGLGPGAPLLLEPRERRVRVCAAEVDPAQPVLLRPTHHAPVQRMVGTHLERALMAPVVDQLDRVAEHVVNATGHGPVVAVNR